MTEVRKPLRILGAPGSPYTRKMLALLRYRHIPYAITWGSHRSPPRGLPEAKVKLLPTVYFEDAASTVEAHVDSTPISRKLEANVPGRAVRPLDPVLAFFDHLLEDYGDEWLTKAMFHYRWVRQVDIDHAGAQLVFWNDPTISAEMADPAISMISKRQVDRLYVVGSNDVTRETIEASYGRFLDILEALIASQGYVLGKRPSAADFALYGQLTQLGIVDPTPAAICNARAPRVRAWLDRMEDLSGLEPSAADWLTRDQIGRQLSPFLAEVGRTYTPFLIANSKAIAAGETSFSAFIDGRAWQQPVFAYQAKCLAWIREAFEALDADDRAFARDILNTTNNGDLIT
jgi:glutathione S-transferase